jgi:hypothetical protein
MWRLLLKPATTPSDRILRAVMLTVALAIVIGLAFLVIAFLLAALAIGGAVALCFVALGLIVAGVRKLTGRTEASSMDDGRRNVRVIVRSEPIE